MCGKSTPALTSTLWNPHVEQFVLRIVWVDLVFDFNQSLVVNRFPKSNQKALPGPECRLFQHTCLLFRTEVDHAVDCAPIAKENAVGELLWYRPQEGRQVIRWTH